MQWWGMGIFRFVYQAIVNKKISMRMIEYLHSIYTPILGKYCIRKYTIYTEECIMEFYCNPIYDIIDFGNIRDMSIYNDFIFSK